MDPQLLDRYKFIDFLIMFKGRLTRSELVKRFTIGEATASRTIASYIEAYPSVIEYKGPRKGYIVRQGFTPTFAHEALAGLKYVATGELLEKVDVACFGFQINRMQKILDAREVAVITRSIVDKSLVSLEYVSATSGSKRRNVAPHAIFEAGGAWYFRAYDTATLEFRTFHFSRIASAVNLGPAEHPAQLEARDDSWHRMRIIRLMPHPKNPLPDAQLLDLGVGDKEIKELMVSEACLGFVLTDLRVDCSKARKLNCYEYPLALKNRSELEAVESMSFSPGFTSNKFK